MTEIIEPLISGHVFDAEPVFLIAPYRSDPTKEYQRECIRDSIDRKEAPIMPATYVFGSLGRGHGSRVALRHMWSWLHFANKVVVYQDMGLSDKMKEVIDECLYQGMKLEYRKIR